MLVSFYSERDIWETACLKNSFLGLCFLSFSITFPVRPPKNVSRSRQKQSLHVRNVFFVCLLARDAIYRLSKPTCFCRCSCTLHGWFHFPACSFFCEMSLFVEEGSRQSWFGDPSMLSLVWPHVCSEELQVHGCREGKGFLCNINHFK